MRAFHDRAPGCRVPARADDRAGQHAALLRRRLHEAAGRHGAQQQHWALGHAVQGHFWPQQRRCLRQHETDGAPPLTELVNRIPKPVALDGAPRRTSCWRTARCSRAVLTVVGSCAAGRPVLKLRGGDHDAGQRVPDGHIFAQRVQQRWHRARSSDRQRPRAHLQMTSCGRAALSAAAVA